MPENIPLQNLDGKSRPEKVDVAINILGKPFQTALTILSLLARSGGHVGKLWLQFEPVGSKFDSISPYHICEYLKNELGCDIVLSQPGYWLDRDAIDLSKMDDEAYRMGIRFQNAFEHSQSRLLFLTHNDVYILKDILGALKNNMGDAFAIGQLGQCWNCPASNAELMREVMDSPPCGPARYLDVRPSQAQLLELYRLARKRGIFARPYEVEGFLGEFEKQPWPLPECRVNEWACLLDLQKTRPHCMPYGDAYPPGAHRLCAGHNLDIACPWFRDMHAKGMEARHFDIKNYMKHWVGTGNKSPGRYAIAEDNALRILRKFFPEFLKWLEGVSGRKNLAAE